MASVVVATRNKKGFARYASSLIKHQPERIATAAFKGLDMVHQAKVTAGILTSGGSALPAVAGFANAHRCAKRYTPMPHGGLGKQ